LLSVITPRMTPSSTIGATARRWSIGVMPASSTRTSATYLKRSPLMHIESDGLSGLAAPIAAERSSSSRPMPFASTVPSWRYQPMLSTPTWVMFPPKQPYRSSSVVRAPARAAARAALKPPGPLPTTRTSVSWTTSTERAASVIAFISRGQARVGPGSRRLDGEHRRRLDADADGRARHEPARIRGRHLGDHERLVRQRHLGSAKRAEEADRRDAGVAVVGRPQPDVLRSDQRLDLTALGGSLEQRHRRPEDVHRAALRGRCDPIGQADEFGHETGLRPVVQRGRRADLPEPPGRHHADAVAHRERLLLIVGHEERRDADHDLDPADLLTELAPHLGVECRERLVEEQHLGLDRERSCKCDALLLAAGHLMRVPAGLLAEPDELECLLRLALPRRPVHAT